MLGMGGFGYPSSLPIVTTDTTQSTSTTTGSGIFAGGVGIAKALFVGEGLHAAGNSIVGSTTVTPDGTLHVHTATAGTVTANADANDFVIENSGAGGMSTLVPDASNANFFLGSPTQPIGAGFQWNYTAGTLDLFTQKVGAIARLQAGNAVTNITLSGAAGSEDAAFAGTASLVKGVTAWNATAVPAGGTTGSGYKFSSTANLGFFFGSGAPTLSAAQGSYYIRTDGLSTSTRAYINTDGATAWTAITTAT